MRANRNRTKRQAGARAIEKLSARSCTKRGGYQGRLLRAEVLEPRQLLSATFTVNTTVDDPSGPTSGSVTLRDAINAVNASTTDTASNPDVINFNIAGTSTVLLSADLPALINPAILDGSTQAGVTVNGRGFAVLTDQSTVTVKAVTFTNGSLVVNAGATLSVVGNLALGDAAGDSTLVQNSGQLSVAGNVLAGAFTGLDNLGTAVFSVSGDVSLGDNSYVYNGQAVIDSASFTVGGNLSIGMGGFVYNTGRSTFNLTGNLSLGEFGFLSNGAGSSSAVTASFNVGGSLSIGTFGSFFGDGSSTFSVTGDFTLGDGGSLDNGGSSSDAATLNVGGSIVLGADFANVYNNGTSSIAVAHNFTVGDGGYVYNGNSASDAASLTVGGNFTLGIAGGGLTFIYNEGTSVVHVTGSFSLLGAWSFVFDGDSNSDAAVLTVGGNFSLDSDALLEDLGSSVLSVTGSFNMGAASYFVDDGAMSIGGAFDPGSAAPSNHNVVAGVFNALPGSSVTTDSATLEVISGGQLNVATGATFTIPAGGVLLNDGGGHVLVEGAMTVNGTFAGLPASVVVVDEQGSVTPVGAGQVNIQGTYLVWNNPAGLAYGVALGASQLDATATTLLAGSYITLPGTFTYTLGDGSTPAGGAVLGVGTAQALHVTFKPTDSADYAGASAQVAVNVGKASQAINFASLASPINYAPNETVTLTATGGASGNTVVFAIDPASTGSGSITGNVLSVGGAGTLLIDANQAGNANYNAAAQVQQTLVVNASATASITATPGAAVVLGTGVPLTATATVTGASGMAGKVTFTLTGPTGAIVDTETLNVAGNGAFATPSGYVPKVAGTYQWAASFQTSAITVSSAKGAAPEVVVGAGATVIGNVLYLVGSTTTGGNSNDQVQIAPIGASSTGSTGVQVQGRLNGVNLNAINYTQSLSTVYVVGGNENATIAMAAGLTLSTVITEGNGNDSLQLGNGNNIVTLGDGTDSLVAGDGANTITIGNGNSTVRVGNGNNVVTMGNGNDSVVGGNGNNLIVGGLGHENIQVGNGRNILIDGAVQLTKPGDSLTQVLSDWIHDGAADYGNINARLKVTYNTKYNNQIKAGSGLDWFWFTNSKDQINRKASDLLN